MKMQCRVLILIMFQSESSLTPACCENIYTGPSLLVAFTWCNNILLGDSSWLHFRWGCHPQHSSICALRDTVYVILLLFCNAYVGAERVFWEEWYGCTFLSMPDIPGGGGGLTPFLRAWLTRDSWSMLGWFHLGPLLFMCPFNFNAWPPVAARDVDKANCSA